MVTASGTHNFTDGHSCCQGPILRRTVAPSRRPAPRPAPPAAPAPRVRADATGPWGHGLLTRGGIEPEPLAFETRETTRGVRSFGGSDQVNNAQFLISQVGSGEKRRAALSLLLEPTDIPGGEWEIYNEKSWRAGRLGKGEANRRRRRTGSFNAMRTYKNNLPDASGAILIEIRQYGNEADAFAELPNARLNLSPSPNHLGATLTEATLIDVPSVWESNSAFCIEQCISHGDRLNTHRCVVDSVGEVVFLTDFVALGEGSPWDEVLELWKIQASRIRTKLGDSAAE